MIENHSVDFGYGDQFSFLLFMMLVSSRMASEANFNIELRTRQHAITFVLNFNKSMTYEIGTLPFSDRHADGSSHYPVSTVHFFRRYLRNYSQFLSFPSSNTEYNRLRFQHKEHCKSAGKYFDIS